MYWKIEPHESIDADYCLMPASSNSDHHTGAKTMNDNGERKMTTSALMKRSKQNDERFLEEEEEMSLDEWCCKLPYTHRVNVELRELRELRDALKALQATCDALSAENRKIIRQQSELAESEAPAPFQGIQGCG